jgi:soluble lytic murein transglycosylase
MRVAISPISVPRQVFRGLALLLTLFVVLPVAGHSSGASTSTSADPAASSQAHKAARRTKQKAVQETAPKAATPAKAGKKGNAPDEDSASAGQKAKKTARANKKSDEGGEGSAQPEVRGKKSSRAGATAPAGKKGNAPDKDSAPTGQKSKKTVRGNKKGDDDGEDSAPAIVRGKKSSRAGVAAQAVRTSRAGKRGKSSRWPVRRASKAVRRAQTARIRLAFQASAELRPMAQQLTTLRTPSAYAGVTQYAHQHSGEAAAAAYLALGRASLLDKRYAEAVADLRLARQSGEELADYADFLAARANHEAGSDAAAEALLNGFATRYPDSIFVNEAPELEANVLMALKDLAGARRVLAAAQDTEAADRPGYQLAEGQVLSLLGQAEEAERVYKLLLLGHPLSPEAQTAWSRLTAVGAESSLTTAELRSLGDAYYNAGHYEDAGERYRALARRPGLDAASRSGFAVAVAACDLKLKRLTTSEAESLPDTPDENGARRLYLLMELARSRNDLDSQRHVVAEMESRFPASPWLAEALYSSGNLYLLRHEYPAAIEYYSQLATRFPSNKRAAAAHWRAGWLSYRQGLYAEAARLFDEQIRLYPSDKETGSALYWRGRLYETEEHKPALAAANYRAVIRAYQHFYYAQMARQRLSALNSLQAGAPASVQTGAQADVQSGAQLSARIAPPPQLDGFQPPQVPPLIEDFPTDSPHLAKAHLLANAGLNDYIAREIAADPDSTSWSALAEAEIYTSYGENFRAMRSLKRALPYAASAPINAIPLAYWRILFPEPWWGTIKAESAKNHLDPYLVASLIRQESEFNPSAVSPANAYGLMQMLPSVGKAMAHEEGIGHFETFQLLDPDTNIRLGTRYLRQTLDRFGGVTEYALAAYNAGGERVVDWQAAGPYRGIDEFVESIPFTETREYVQSILRNVETYRAIDEFAASKGTIVAGKGQ